MNIALIVRHRGGSAAYPEGTVQEFEQGRIRIGRGVDCQLRFDADEDRAVSTEHAELVIDDDGVILVDLDSRNGVFLNDVRVSGDEALANGDVVRFGADGPQFAVEFGEGSAVGREELPKETVADRSAKKSIGMSTLIGVVDKSVERERRRNRVVMVPIVVVLLAAVVTLLVWPDDEPQPWRETLEDANKSVYVCATVTGGVASPFGTAWSLGDGKLATNSHVAIEFENLRADQQFVVRSSESPPRDIRIVKVTLHPGYRRWTDLIDKYDPYIPGQGFQRMLPPACDVAVLEVHADDVGMLAPGLPIASRAEMADLKPGDELALLGYPMEGQAGSGINMGAPFPQLRPGTVARTTNYFVGADDVADRRLVGLNLMSAGGASGSPVFARDGKVVAVNSAGDYLQVSLKGLRVSSGGAYGQRADTLLDLIEGRATGADAATADALEKEFVTRFENGITDSDKFAFWLAGQVLNSGETLGKPHKEPFTIDKDGFLGAKELTGFESTQAGDHVRVIVPTTAPVSPIVATFVNGKYVPNPTGRYYLLDRATMPKGLKVKTKVQVLPGALEGSPIGYVLYWYPLNK